MTSSQKTCKYLEENKHSGHIVYIFIVLTYSCHSVNFKKSSKKNISYVKSTWNRTLLITADMNINILDQQNSFTRCYKDMVEQFNLIQIVQTPTRTSRTSSTLIDYIIIVDAGVVKFI